jgi:hypothetical protein
VSEDRYRERERERERETAASVRELSQHITLLLLCMVLFGDVCCQ